MWRMLMDKCSRIRTLEMNGNPCQPAALKTPNVWPLSIGFGSNSPTLFQSQERRPRNFW
jgi:hypothetical protein